MLGGHCTVAERLSLGVLTTCEQITDSTNGVLTAFDLTKIGDPGMIKFLLSTLLALLGLIEFFMAAGLLIYVCAKPVKVTNASTVSLLPRDPAENDYLRKPSM